MVNDGNFCSKECTGFCCCRYTVLLTTEDILRILNNTPLKPHQFLSLYEANEDTSKYFPKIKINSEEVVVGLKQRDDGSCIFFLEQLGLCGMHFFKPLVCHTYPFTLNSKDELVRLKNVCPSDWYPENTREIKQIIHQAWQEMNKNQKKVEFWNKNYSTRGFFDFINFIKNGKKS